MLWRHTYHVSADRLCHYAAHRGFGTPSSREGRGCGWHQGWAHCGLGEEWRRQGSRAHSHRNRDRGWRWGLRSAQRRSGLSLRSRHHLADDAVKEKRATIKHRAELQALQNPVWKERRPTRRFFMLGDRQRTARWEMASFHHMSSRDRTQAVRRTRRGILPALLIY